MGAATAIDWRALEQQLRAFLPAKAVVSKAQELLSYNCDGLTMERHQPPLAVLPESTADVAAILKLCQQLGVPFVARGSGTGLSGGALVEQPALLVITSRMRQVLSVDLANQRITVQPGVINSWVTRAVSGDGFYFAPDPSSQVACSVGGNVAENSGGVHCLKYGVTSNHVLELEVVLPDGTITTLGGPLAEMPGLDLRGVFIGSEAPSALPPQSPCASCASRKRWLFYWLISARWKQQGSGACRYGRWPVAGGHGNHGQLHDSRRGFNARSRAISG